jgi:hemerythrin superfamily protein
MGAEAVDVIDAIRDDHAEIRELLDEVRDTRDRYAFEQLVRKLTAHEAAEEEVVHPIMHRVPGGEPVVEETLREEHDGKSLLTHLERMGVDDPRFGEQFGRLYAAVLDHAAYEESEEHPKLAESVGPSRLARMAHSFRAATHDT